MKTITIRAPKKRTRGIDKALEDVEKGRVYAAKNTKDLMEKLLLLDTGTHSDLF